MFDELLKTSMTKYIDKVFTNSFRKEWYTTYWVIDIHSTVIKPSYNLNDKTIEFYPFAKEVLQILTKRDDIHIIMWTSSYQNEIDNYIKEFEKFDIHFDNINENPNISSNNGNFGFYEQKFYFNVILDDKAAFCPNSDWEPLYNLLKKYEEENYLPNPNWTKKF